MGEQTGPGKVTLSSAQLYSNVVTQLAPLPPPPPDSPGLPHVRDRTEAGRGSPQEERPGPQAEDSLGSEEHEGGDAPNERKPWQPPKQRQFSDSYEEESRPKACVGICYYNKLMALEAKEDLASHNLVYKDQKEEPCDNDSACNEMEEDIIFNTEQQEGKPDDNNVILIDGENQG